LIAASDPTADATRAALYLGCVLEVKQNLFSLFSKKALQKADGSSKIGKVAFWNFSPVKKWGNRA